MFSLKNLRNISKCFLSGVSVFSGYPSPVSSDSNWSIPQWDQRGRESLSGLDRHLEPSRVLDKREYLVIIGDNFW